MQVSLQGCSLQANDTPIPLFNLQEPLLLVQGVAVNSQTVHLVYLKTNGDLCYSLISRAGIKQTTLLTKLDVRSTKYRRLILLPLGEKVHIFYAYANQAIPDLWNIEHRFWNGKTWQSVHLGEVVHPRYPLYHVSTDIQGNIHVLSLTFQGRQSLLMYNRFHGTFSIWGNPNQVMKISKEVLDMTSILTPDNIHHLFWVAKNPGDQLEVNWAKRPNVQDLSSTWHQASAPIHTMNGPWQGLGAMEINGSLWLLIKAAQEYLMLFEGESWRQIISLPSQHRPLEFIRKTEKSFYHTYWLEDHTRLPLFAKQIGLNFSQNVIIPPQPVQNQQIPIQIPIQPATNPVHNPVSPISIPNVTPELSIPVTHSMLEPTPDVPKPQPIVAALIVPEQETPSPTEIEGIEPHGLILPETLAPLIAEAINPLLKTVSALAEERQNLAVALETVLSSHIRTESALKEVEKQVRELKSNQQTEKEKGFWQRWFK